MNRVIKIEGLDCANCARELEEEIEKISGVKSVTVDFMGEKVLLECDQKAIADVVDCCNHFEEVKVTDEDYKPNAKRDSVNRVIKIEGLDCANCARELEEEIEKISGVKSVTVDFMGQKVLLECDQKAIADVVDCCNHFEEVKVTDEDYKIESINNKSENDVVDGKKIKIANLCCANCGRELEEDLNKIDGVSATVDFMNMTVVIKSSSTEAYDKAIYTISHFEDVKIVDEKPERKGVFNEHLAEILRLAIATVLFIPALILDVLNLGNVVEIIAYVIYGIAYVTVGYPVLIKTVKNLAKGKIFDENFLMTLASIGAIVLGVLTGEGFMEGVAVMLLYQLGELLQGIAVGSSRRSISDLLDLKSDTATLIKDGEQVVVSPEDLKVGDTILIKAGEKIPVDCKITKGATSLDMKSLNGEAIPKDVNEGDEILSGSINLSKVIEAEVIREYSNSAVAKIMELVESSSAKKAQSEKFISKFAKYYTPAVVIAAVLVAVLVPTIICAVQGAYVWSVYCDWIYKALSFLVISCPCALVISVPLSYFSGIGRCAHFGILVKGSTCLDELANATIAAFDKTGTITEGSFAVKTSSSDEALKLAACAEKFSSHPIAAAFANVETPYVADNAEEIAGRGVSCKVNGKKLLCGNAKLLRENSVNFEEISSLSTVVYVALDGEYVGVIEIDDKIKDGAKEALQELYGYGVDECVMLTGDSVARAESVGKEVGLTSVKAGLLPDEKLEEATKLMEKGGLIYVGDGINDAPVMTAANCAVSMGQVGSDAAIEASDLVLVTDNLRLLPKARKIAKKTRSIVYQNIVGSLIIKFAIMALDIAIVGFPMIVAIFADVGVMLLAVLNAMRTSRIK
jgi:Cd2+/Zn2+-exporting ATPase